MPIMDLISRFLDFKPRNTLNKILCWFSKFGSRKVTKYRINIITLKIQILLYFISKNY